MIQGVMILMTLLHCTYLVKTVWGGHSESHLKTLSLMPMVSVLLLGFILLDFSNSPVMISFSHHFAHLWLSSSVHRFPRHVHKKISRRGSRGRDVGKANQKYWRFRMPVHHPRSIVHWKIKMKIMDIPREENDKE